jgi:hypothetical protein
MRKILAVILFVMLMAFPVLTFAEEVEPTVEENVPPVEEVVTEEENEPTMTENIVEYVKEHLEEIFVIVAGVLFTFYEGIVRKKMNGSIGTLNNNAVTIATDSAKGIKDALGEVKDIANIVKNYKEELETMLSEVRKNGEEKQSLEDTLNRVMTFLNTSKLACLEMSNEVAELLVLANIPNSKKEELYARHTQAVHELEKAEGVIADDGEKA